MSGKCDPATYVKCASMAQHESAEHRAVCLSYVRQRYQISGPITIVFPGECGQAEADHPEWHEVRRNTVAVCACGRDRAVFPPIELQPEPAAGLGLDPGDPIELGDAELLCIRSSAGACHAHFEIAIEDGQLVLEADPITGIGDLLGGVPEETKVRTSALADLAPLLAADAVALPCYDQDAGARRLVFAITAIDAAAHRLTIRLGAEMETFVPETAAEAD